MIYLSQLLGIPVIDADGDKIGTVNDLGIATGEVFPRITSLAFVGPGKTPFMISWRKYVESLADDGIRLKVPSTEIRFSYLQPDEVLIARDLLNKQIVDTRGMKVVRVNDLKLSDTDSSQLRLLGAEVGMRGILRSLHPAVEHIVVRASKALGRELPENIIAWNYMDLLDRDLSDVKLSVSHKTLDELHPADIADIIEQLDPRLRGQVFAQLDDAQAALAMAELDDEEMAAEVLDDMADIDASKMLSEMDPDDAAELVGELDYERAEKLLRLMGVNERRAVRQLLGYKEDTAGRIMTSEVLTLPPDATVRQAIARLKEVGDEVETIHYLYLTDTQRHLKGVVSLRDLVIAKQTAVLSDLAELEPYTASPEDDQEDVAETISKYNLLALPVVDEGNRLLGIVTVDDALDVLQEEHEEDLRIAGRVPSAGDETHHVLTDLLSSEMWVAFWILGIGIVALLSGRGEWMVLALAACVGMPVCLRAADSMVRYVTNFMLEYDEDDEDAPSLAGFGLRGIATALVYAVLLALIVWGGENLLVNRAADAASTEAALAGWQLIAMADAGLFASAAIVVLLFALAPLLLTILRRQLANESEPSGTVVRALMIALAMCAFVAIVKLLIVPGLG